MTSIEVLEFPVSSRNLKKKRGLTSVAVLLLLMTFFLLGEGPPILTSLSEGGLVCATR